MPDETRTRSHFALLRQSFVDQSTTLFLVALPLLFSGIILKFFSKSLPDEYKSSWPEYILDVFSLLLTEIAFALIIAIIIANIFEMIAKDEIHNKFEDNLNSIKENVFSSVLKTMLPETLSTNFIEQMRSISVLRRNLDVSYELKNGFCSDKNGEKHHFLKVTSNISFDFENTSAIEKTINAGIYLPDPILTHLRDQVEMISYLVDNEDRKNDERDKDFRKRMNGNDATKDDQVFYNCGSITIPKGSSIRVVATYAMAKEIEDTEIITSRYHTNEFIFRLHDSTSDDVDLIVRAGLIGSGPFHDKGQPQKKNYRWERREYDGWLMPHQGVKVWWKMKPKVDIESCDDTPV